MSILLIQSVLVTTPYWCHVSSIIQVRVSVCCRLFMHLVKTFPLLFGRSWCDHAYTLLHFDTTSRCNHAHIKSSVITATLTCGQPPCCIVGLDWCPAVMEQRSQRAIWPPPTALFLLLSAKASRRSGVHTHSQGREIWQLACIWWFSQKLSFVTSAAQAASQL